MANKDKPLFDLPLNREIEAAKTATKTEGEGNHIEQAARDKYKGENPVSVLLNLHRESGQLYLRVEVRSILKPHNVTGVNVDPKRPRLVYRVELAGAAAAEHQNETIGENHDPLEIARLAKKAFAKLMDHIDKNNPRLAKNARKQNIVLH